MTEVERTEPGSDQMNAEILEKTGTDPSTVTMLVDAEDAEIAAEEERMGAVAEGAVTTPELEQSGPVPDAAPPADERHDEYEELPEFSPGM